MAKSPQDFGVPDAHWDEKTATLSQAIGFFLVCFGRLELTITLTLAIVLGYDKDYERFDVVAGGLNASGRVARLTQAAKLCKIPIGKNLKALLGLFSKTDCNIRNSICHSWPMLDDEEIVHFGNLSAIPKFMGRGPHRPTGKDPTAHSIGHLYVRALWMLKFNEELIRAIRLRPIEALEVNPKNLSPPRAPQAPATAAGPTKIDRRALKAQRKALRKPPVG